jgi:anti-sigma B factor antagonist
VNRPRTGLSLRCTATSAKPGTVRVTVFGDIDFATAELLRAGLIAVLEHVPLSALDLDLSAVDFCDCTGLHALMTVHGAARLMGCRVTISAARLGPGRLLELTGLGPHFGYAPTRVEPRGSPVEFLAEN